MNSIPLCECEKAVCKSYRAPAHYRLVRTTDPAAQPGLYNAFDLPGKQAVTAPFSVGNITDKEMMDFNDHKNVTFHYNGYEYEVQLLKW